MANGFSAGLENSVFSTPSFSHSSSCISHSSTQVLWANMIASTISSSGICPAKPSIISTLVFDPPTIRSRSLWAISAWVGKRTSFPSTRPTRTLAIGPPNGTGASIRAAEAPKLTSGAGSFSPSLASTFAIT